MPESSAPMPNRSISLPAPTSMLLSYPASCLVDNLTRNGASHDKRQRKISLERLNTKVGRRRQSLPILPSYLTLTSASDPKPVEEKVQKKRRKGVSFPLGVVMQQAVADGDMQELKQLVSKHGKKAVEEREPNGLPPAMRAIFEDQLDCLKVLVEAGADVTARDPENWNALHVAAAMDDLEAAEIILNASSEPQCLTESRNMDGERPIDLTDSLEMARFLLHADLAKFRKQAPVETSTCSDASSEEAVLRLVQDHCEKHQNCTALDEVLKINTCYTSLLHLAAAKNYGRLADYVCEYRLTSLEARDKQGWTALHTAAYYNNLDVAILLVEQGANRHALTHSYEKPSDLTDHQLIQTLLEENFSTIQTI